MRDFMWKKTVWKVVKKILALEKEHGGLEIPDIQTFIQSRKIKWLIKIRFSDIDNWNKIGHNILTKLDE